MITYKLCTKYEGATKIESWLKVYLKLPLIAAEQSKNAKVLDFKRSYIVASPVSNVCFSSHNSLPIYILEAA